MRALYKRLREQRKNARIIGVTLSVALLLVGAIVFIVLKSLPSTNELRAKYFSSRLHKPVSTVVRVQDPVTETVSGATSPAPTTAAVQTAQPVGAAVAVAPLSLTDYVVDRYVDGSDRSLRVCQNLTSTGLAAPTDNASFGRNLQAQIEGPQINPFAEAALAPLGALMQLPSVGGVVRQIRDVQDSGDRSLLRQAQFYSEVAYAAAEVYRNKAVIDALSEHAYHLSVMARLAALNPSLANDVDFQNFCSSVELSAVNSVIPTPEEIESERSALMGLIASSGRTPSQVGFDPSLSTQTSISVQTDRVMFGSPWMMQMFGSGLLLSANP